MEVEKIAQILLQWGPAGAAAVLIFVAEKKLRDRWDSAKENDRTMCAWLYAGNWISIMTLLAVVSICWVQDKKNTNVTLAGIVQDLGPSWKINDPTKELFTRTILKNQFLHDVQWHYANSNLPAPRCFKWVSRN